MSSIKVRDNGEGVCGIGEGGGVKDWVQVRRNGGQGLKKNQLRSYHTHERCLPWLGGSHQRGPQNGEKGRAGRGSPLS